MTYGFRFRGPDEQIQVDSTTFGFLYIDDFYVTAGITTRTYASMAGLAVNVASMGTSAGLNPNSTITQVASGADLVVTVDAAAAGRYLVTLE